MSARARLDALFGAVAALTLLWLAAASAPAAPAARAAGFSAYANLLQLLLLVVAGVSAYRSAVRLGPGNPARPPWRLLAAGLGAFWVAEALDAWYEVAERVSRPFPSLADALFVGAYLLVVRAFLLFIRLYRAWGDEVGSARQHALIALGGAAVLGAAGYGPLRSIATSAAGLPERLLGVAYPLLDFAVLILALVLLRITAAFRGGRVWRVWMLLLAGFVFTCVADVLFAFLSAGGVAVRRPLMEALYVLSYLALARGTLEQHELLAS